MRQTVGFVNVLFDRPYSKIIIYTELTGTFLIREGHKGNADLALSLVCDAKVWHYKIQKTPIGYHFYGLEFATLTELVGYHMLNAGKMLTTLRDSPLQ